VRQFEHVPVRPHSDDTALEVLEDAVESVEARYGIVFSIQSLRAIVAAARRTRPDLPPHDAAVELLYSIVPTVVSVEGGIVRRVIIEAALSEATGVPQGTATGAEAAMLGDIEARLATRVIGQDEALSAVASGLRKARSGLGDDKKPMASFLLIGPTGVGKTETAKALAQTLFNDERAIVRLDMTEFSSNDAADKLIGSYTTGEPGILSSRLRDTPYCVLLLDEFEKCVPKALDVFLQILDEGIFRDGRGEVVNARNAIIVATSNAGSDLIHAAGSANPPTKAALIEHVIATGVFKPELINRFDAVALYRPIAGDTLRNVVMLSIKKLVARLRERGIELMITPTMVDAAVAAVGDPRFGARELERAVSAAVEDPIARAMLAGTVVAGSKIELVPSTGGGGDLSVEIR
jgi:ATP-dependent Clp protease ATP-binding subunit ClpA